MDLTNVLNILQTLSKQAQKTVMSVADFNQAKSVRVVYHEIIDTMNALCRNAHNKQLLSVYREAPVPDEDILRFFGNLYTDVAPLSFSDEALEFIKKRVYRNMEGNFRIIPQDVTVGTDSIPPEGLLADEEILRHELSYTRQASDGSQQSFDGFKELCKQQYEPPYDGIYRDLAPALQRVTIQSTFDGTPCGFYKKDNKIYRNVISQMLTVNPKMCNDVSLRRAMFLMFLVAGGNMQNFQELYALIHFIVNVPNSNTGYIIYLNDFDAGGNGKSKFVSMLGEMFGYSYTAFEPHQLRFNMGLMGKRLVHISEFENNETSNELMSMLKSMTGRDKFQYEGKGSNPIVSDTHQNFIITSNRYIYFDDTGIKRRLQNFHCSNFLHILLNKYFKSSKFLNKLLGNSMNLESVRVKQEMANSLLNYLLNDPNSYEINLRPQDYVLGNLNNPILRILFGSSGKWKNNITENKGVTTLHLKMFDTEAESKHLNYAASVLTSWLPELEPSRNNDELYSAKPPEELIQTIKQKIAELDETSKRLKNKHSVTLEYGDFNGFNTQEMLYEFFGEEINRMDVPCEETETGVTIL